MRCTNGVQHQAFGLLGILGDHGSTCGTAVSAAAEGGADRSNIKINIGTSGNTEFHFLGGLADRRFG